eukprot:jgi/Botrbrau1/23439/Bobra.0712s0001.1
MKRTWCTTARQVRVKVRKRPLLGSQIGSASREERLVPQHVFARDELFKEISVFFFCSRMNSMDWYNLGPGVPPGRFVCTIVALLIGPLSSCANEINHKYVTGETVNLWVNKVGPYNNPQETYNYYYLPFCRPSGQLKAPAEVGRTG